MAGELIAQFDAGDLYRETCVGYSIPFQSCPYSTTSGSSRGVSLEKLISAQLTEYYNLQRIVPAAAALATGITVRFMISDDGTDAVDLGKVVRVEVIPYNLSTALSVMDMSLAASKGTTSTTNVTLGATTGLPVIGTIAIANAGLASLAVGNILGLRIRRVGDNAADTAVNRVIFYGGIITNT